jgi:hypothetical protein
VLLTRHAYGDKPIDGPYLKNLEFGLQAQMHFTETSKESRFMVAHLHDLGGGSCRQIGQTQSVWLFDRPVQGRYGRTVRIACGMPQVLIEEAFKVFRDMNGIKESL